jgi:hypothetical protein
VTSDHADHERRDDDRQHRLDQEELFRDFERSEQPEKSHAD